MPSLKLPPLRVALWRTRWRGPTWRGHIEGPGDPPIRFCETNPPIWRAIYCVSSVLEDTYVVCRPRLQVGSFWKTNPPGRRFEGCFPCFGTAFAWNLRIVFPLGSLPSRTCHLDLGTHLTRRRGTGHE